ncbi:MAG: ABC transporter ATP-binding protein [Candidatus Hodarchaeota archaeon]
MPIETMQLTREFGSLIAVDELTLSVKNGEVVAFLGPNGAGKTTTIRMLMGSLRPTRGTARICGFDVVKEGVQARKHIGYVPEENSAYYADMRVKTFCNYIGTLRGLSGEQLTREVHEKLEVVEIGHLAKRRIDTLSSGQKQRLGLAQALLGDPDVVIADEPTANLDPAGKQQIISLIRSLAKENMNRAFFVSTHILAEAEALADRILILNQGKLVADRSIDSLQEEIHSQSFFVNVSDREVLQQALNNNWVEGLRVVSGGLEIETTNPELLFKELPKIIAANDLSLLMFRPAKSRLESVYFESTSQK